MKPSTVFPEIFQQLDHKGCPPRLMTGAKTPSTVSMEVLVEKNIVPPEGIIFK
jgi:hypothetical protein